MFDSILRRVAPSFITCEQWAIEYRELIDLRPLSDQTKGNRKAVLRHVLHHLGGQRMRFVRPVDVGKMIREIAKTSPHTAKRALFETRDFFNEAIIAGVIENNPALLSKAPKVSVLRKRLSLGNWIQIRNWSEKNQPPWVCRLFELALVTAQRRSDLRIIGPRNVWDDRLHVEQIKTGSRVSIPIDLRLEAIDKSIREVIAECESYANPGETFIRRKSGKMLVEASLSARFEEAREGCGLVWNEGLPPSLHECRSLAERLYRAQGVNTRILLGHKNQAMTDIYNNDRGLSKGEWMILD